MAIVPGNSERAQHWFVAGWPVFTAVIALAVSAGIAYNNIGRIAILEADLNVRNSALPAPQTAAILASIQAALATLPVSDAQLQAKIERNNAELMRLDNIAIHGVEQWNGITQRATAAETELRDMRAQMTRLRDDVNALAREASQTKADAAAANAVITSLTSRPGLK